MHSVQQGPFGCGAEGEPVDTSDFSFKWFAQHPFYRAMNERLVAVSDIHPGQKILELACGTGAVTRLIMEKIRGARESLVVAVDMSSEALREAMAQIADVKDVAVEFVQGRAEQASQVIKNQVDTVIFCNGIHYIPDKAELLKEVARTLKTGGIFAFNTSFFQGAHPPETEGFYRKWMYKAIRLVRARYGLMPTAAKVEARHQLTDSQYCDLLKSHGFVVLRKDISPAMVPLQGWLDISRYEDFVAGALPGIPLRQASEALQESVRQTFQEMGLTAVPRNWLTVVAAKP